MKALQSGTAVALLGMTMSISTTSTIITTSIIASLASAFGRDTTIMDTAMADAVRSIAVQSSRVAHIGGTGITLAPTTTEAP